MASTFDRYAEERRNESRQERELAALAEGTEAVERGMANPILWALVVGGLVAMPFTLGASLLVTIAAGVAMSGGPKHMAVAALPMSVDVVAPASGCARIIAALVTIVLVVLVTALVLALIMFNLGGL